MKLSEEDLRVLANCALDAAALAGQVLADLSTQNLTINHKVNAHSLAASVVTEADFQSQALILKTLSPTLEAYDLALLSEEAPDDRSRFDKDYFWCIDPLDGSLPYTEGGQGYAVSIALVSREGQSMIGVVCHPPSGDLWCAIRDAGVCKNGEELSVDHLRKRKEEIMCFIDRSFLESPEFVSTRDFLSSQKIAGAGPIRINHVGGAVMQALTTLEYHHSAYFKFPRSEMSGGSLWDYAATNCIYQTLGLIATDVFANPMDLNRPDATFMNHRGILYSTSLEMTECIALLVDHFNGFD